MLFFKTFKGKSPIKVCNIKFSFPSTTILFYSTMKVCMKTRTILVKPLLRNRTHSNVDVFVSNCQGEGMST